MQFVAICERVRKECSEPGLITSVSGQVGRLGQIVEWAANAYNEICMMRDDWRFLRSRFTVRTVDNQMAYEVTDLTDTRLEQTTSIGFGRYWEDTFTTYLLSAGAATKRDLPFMDYEAFRTVYIDGPTAAQKNLPNCFTIRPDDDALLVGPRPNGVYVVDGEYQIEAPTLSENDEEPLFPPRYHEAIVWLAVQSYATDQRDSALYASAERKFKRYASSLRRTQYIPTVAGPLGG